MKIGGTRAAIAVAVAVWSLACGVSVALAGAGVSGFHAGRVAHAERLTERLIVPVQVPYQDPPEAEFPEIERATPAPDILSAQELKRAEALLPLLEGHQELYVIGEFVHLGKPSVPVLVKALAMPGSRLRYNAIEAMGIIKDPRAVPYLLETAREVDVITRVRAHALRVAVRLAPMDTFPTLRALVTDPHDTIRRTVAFESRRVRRPESVFLLIALLADEEKYVSITALESFWRLTRWSGPPHDWQGSTHEQRIAWAEEWKAWWEDAVKHRNAAPRTPKPDPMSWGGSAARPDAATAAPGR